ncbi:S8 family serine peptidase [Psychroflexus tropicus]|uniref:S8 family serine peptidase n=1 Tax=Psychroflexus tropicus TaxID=197345 RepID=UPI000361658C|nr:S8 family serine peptidase [Psychroflexus tropicus]
MKYIFTLVLFYCISNVLLAQNPKTLEIFEYEKQQELRVDEFKANSTKSLAEQQGVRLWDVINGLPIYIEDLNVRAARSTRTDFIKPEGDLGLNLAGTGFDIGIWEVGGIPQPDHIEYGDRANESRIKVVDSIETSFHATHVAGTLIARGELPQAQGMAIAATLSAYDSPSDLSEALREARDNELLISNHSYGVPIANIEGNEWLAGAYNNTARVWDNVTNLYPYYLPVYAGGNDGNVEYEGGLAPGYDKLTTNSNSKNLLIVANAANVVLDGDTGVMTNAIINSGSSQGPTDDGRIKPDIAGLGTSIVSTAPGNQYGTATGTSMASPNVAGSALLLQELYGNLNEDFMLSSTLKGLISVTADDAGPVGPDPFFGWGVMNSKRAAEAIINNGDGDIILEKTLIQGRTETMRISTNSQKAMRVAIAWNDPAGTAAPNGVFNDPTPVLVNDLDLRINNIENPEIVFNPWLLNSRVVSEPAFKGDNIVDNIEIIELEGQGTFDISITHKGDLDDGEQVYSLIVLNGDEETLSNANFDETPIAFWPNPVKNKLNISSSEINFSKDLQVSIYDLTGRKLIDLNDLESTSNLTIDVSTLSRGLYILSLTDGNQSIQKRIIKE